MISHGHRVYRGQSSKASSLPAVLLFLVVFFALMGLLAFSLLPQYLVYHRDSVEMVVPMLEESGEPYTITAIEGPAPYGMPVDAGVQVAAPDYSLVRLADGAGLNYMQCYYVPISRITESGFDSAVKEAERSLSAVGAKGLVLEMKDDGGRLAWVSNVATASSVAANSTWDPSAVIAELKADGWYLVAKISCGVDTLLATKGSGVALRDPNGAVYATGAGSWVDLWNRSVRNYTIDLCLDLIDMGFDEIILSRVEHPNANVMYTRDVASGLDRQACVMNFAIAVRQGLSDAMAKNGVHLCAQVDHGVLNLGVLDNGQSLDNFLRVFDRLVIATGTYSQDAPVFTASKYDSTLRFAPQMTWAFGGGSWVLDPNAPTE